MSSSFLTELSKIRRNPESETPSPNPKIKPIAKFVGIFGELGDSAGVANLTVETFTGEELSPDSSWRRYFNKIVLKESQ